MGLGWKELLIILVIVIVVFGTRKLINAGGDLGKAIRSFKQGMKEGEDAAGPEDKAGGQLPGKDDANR
jgi:sec-independent protein translocase protein TatA